MKAGVVGAQPWVHHTSPFDPPPPPVLVFIFDYHLFIFNVPWRPLGHLRESEVSAWAFPMQGVWVLMDMLMPSAWTFCVHHKL